MSSEDPFRNPSNSPSVELCCPHCKRNLYIAPPESLVTLTACPHLDCHCVALICTGKDVNRGLVPWWEADGSIAVTFERFVDTRTRKVEASNIAAYLLCVGLFVVAPVNLWTHAWCDGGAELMIMVMLITSPAALIGLSV